MKVITFPSFAWRKCFPLRKVRWRVEATFFTGNCIVASRESCGPVEIELFENIMKLGGGTRE